MGNPSEGGERLPTEHPPEAGDDLVPNEVQLPWSTVIYGALAGGVAALPAAALGLADVNAAIVAFFGPFWTAGYGLILSAAAVASDYLLRGWPRPQRWGLAMLGASLLVVCWLETQSLACSMSEGAPATGLSGLLRIAVWTLLGAALSGLYGSVAGLAASRRAGALRVAPWMGGLVALIYAGVDALFGGPARRMADTGTMLIAWVLMVGAAGALLGLALAWQLRVAARYAGPES